MIKLVNKNICTGCTACASICENHCIEMIEDKEGFKYPQIVDAEKCTSCGKCIDVCPLTKENNCADSPRVICAQNKNADIRKLSSAGGVVGAVFNYVFTEGGVAFGAGFDKHNMVTHYEVCSNKQSKHLKIFSSKYVASQIDGVFLNVKKALEAKPIVCFVGLPCQVAGLKSYLHDEYSNLILIDLTCYGVPSPKLYRKYLAFCQDKFGSKIIDVNFRDKMFGYSAPSMSISFENGKKYSQNSIVKSFLRVFFANLSIRPSCSKCHFKTINRVSDLTIGDCKNIGDFEPMMDDDKGTTVVYIHSSLGEEIVEALSASQLMTVDVNISKILKTCGTKMIDSVVMSKDRDFFFEDIDDLRYQELIDKYCPANSSEHFANIFKTMIRILGLSHTSILKHIKDRIRK